MRSFSTKKETVAALHTQSSQPCVSAQSKAQQLSAYFSSVFTIEPERPLPACSDSSGLHSILNIIQFSEVDVFTQLRSLDPQRFPGLNGLHPKVLKELAAEITKPLMRIFQQSFQLGVVPLEWKLANVTPLLKKDDCHLAINYHPVSLTCVACKVMERLVKKTIIEHLENGHLLSRSQHGLRSGRSTVSNLLESFEACTAALDKETSMNVSESVRHGSPSTAHP